MEEDACGFGLGQLCIAGVIKKNSRTRGEESDSGRDYGCIRSGYCSGGSTDE